MRTTREQVEAALRVFKNAAKLVGLDYSDYEFVKYSTGYGLQKDGQWLLVRGQRSLSQWYDILNGAEEALKAVNATKQGD